MRISLLWLRDYLDIKPDFSVETIANTLTMSGLEVESVENLSEISSRYALVIMGSKASGSESRTIYHAQYLGRDIKVSAAEPAISAGSLCAADKILLEGGEICELATYGDLGIKPDARELICFDKEFFSKGVPANLSLVDGFNDTVFTLGITPNRADALSHLGISRELSAQLDIGVKSPMLSLKEMAGPTHERALIEIEDAKGCPRYALRVVENVKVGQSPMWLKMRLLNCGIRPINNVVDVGNFVMLSRGQPMHAFDYDKIKRENGRAKIIIRRAHAGEKLETLDGASLELSDQDLMVCDQDGPLALAGVMGGKASSVTPETSVVLLESAFFDASSVRMSARRHNITTESSYRFERGSDSSGVVNALNYAARLLIEISGGRACREPIDAYRMRIEPKEITMRQGRLQEILGLKSGSFDQDLLRRKFVALGIETVAKRGEAICFRVPTFRGDLEREIDLIEEAARMIGYDKVMDKRALSGADADLFVDKPVELTKTIVKSRLVARGFFECINYSFVNKDFHENFLSLGQEQDVIEVANPLSDRYGVMRHSLLPGLIKNLVHNQRNQEGCVSLFEMGTVFLGVRENRGLPKPEILSRSLDQDSFGLESQKVAGVASGKSSYQAFDSAGCNLDFFYLKGVLSEVFLGLGMSVNVPNDNIVFKQGTGVSYLHPGESATICFRGENGASTELGVIGRLHPRIVEASELTGDAFAFELDIASIAKHMRGAVKYSTFPRFPIIERDVALLCDENIRIDEILQALREIPHGEATLMNARVFDIFRGKNLGPGKKSVALSFTLQNPTRTLTDLEASGFVEQFLDLVAKKTGATVR